MNRLSRILLSLFLFIFVFNVSTAVASGPYEIVSIQNNWDSSQMLVWPLGGVQPASNPNNCPDTGAFVIDESRGGFKEASTLAMIASANNKLISFTPVPNLCIGGRAVARAIIIY